MNVKEYNTFKLLNSLCTEYFIIKGKDSKTPIFNELNKSNFSPNWTFTTVITCLSASHSQSFRSGLLRL
jgi:hypothetical protein